MIENDWNDWIFFNAILNGKKQSFSIIFNHVNWVAWLKIKYGDICHGKIGYQSCNNHAIVETIMQTIIVMIDFQ